MCSSFVFMSALPILGYKLPNKKIEHVFWKLFLQNIDNFNKLLFMVTYHKTKTV